MTTINDVKELTDAPVEERMVTIGRTIDTLIEHMVRAKSTDKSALACGIKVPHEDGDNAEVGHTLIGSPSDLVALTHALIERLGEIVKEHAASGGMALEEADMFKIGLKAILVRHEFEKVMALAVAKPEGGVH